ncbi:MAG: thioredoxin domain-containing protein [Candidatus Binatia bacterium]
MKFKISIWPTIAAIAAALLLWPSSSQAGVEEEIAKLRKELAEIKKELAEIKSILILQGPVRARKPSRVTAEVSVSGKPSLGREDAPVTMVEFSDYQCPFCKRHFLTVLPIIKKEYIDAGKVRYVFRDFPIASLHPQAKKGHEAAYCAGEQNKYWDMHDTLFENSKDFSVPALRRYAREIGLDGDRFNGCLQSGKYASRIEKEIAEGVNAGVRGTPSFIIGPRGSGEKITGTMVRGAQPLARFRQVIENVLRVASKGRKSKPTP